jgi:hypothetical protein
MSISSGVTKPDAAVEEGFPRTHPIAHNTEEAFATTGNMPHVIIHRRCHEVLIQDVQELGNARRTLANRGATRRRQWFCFIRCNRAGSRGAPDDDAPVSGKCGMMEDDVNLRDYRAVNWGRGYQVGDSAYGQIFATGRLADQ